jgi:hypothetical protein
LTMASAPPPPLPIANISKASTCHSQRRKNKRDEGEVAIMVVLADAGGSGLQYALIKKKRKFSSYITKFRMEQLQSHI